MLAYRLDCSGGQAESKRRIYETNLRERGLELEHESAEVIFLTLPVSVSLYGRVELPFTTILPKGKGSDLCYNISMFDQCG